jgi:holliday junction DNA helicase RuvA
VISHLRGQLADKGIDHVVVDVGGVGLRVTVSLHTLAEMPALGGAVRLLTHLIVREDALTLFGFAQPEERTAFELCMSVQQVGPKLAMSILSTLTPQELALAIATEDVARLQRISGVGKKTAERLALELRDKFDKHGIGVPRAVTTTVKVPLSGPVLSALVNLGYKPAEAERAVDEVVAAHPSAPVPELIKRALRALATVG